jgi:excisionase family DNA binding protein
MLTPVPSLDDLTRDPAKAASLPPGVAAALLVQAAAVQSVLAARIASAEAAAPAPAPAPAEHDPLLTIPEVAKLLGFARGYTYELVRRGEIRAVHHGKYWRIPKASVDDFIRANAGRGRLDRTINNMLSKMHDRAAT